MSASNPEIRAARAFLNKKGIRTKQVSPRKFANAAKENNMGFSELLKFISRLYDGDRNLSTWRRGVIEKAAEAGG